MVTLPLQGGMNAADLVVEAAAKERNLNVLSTLLEANPTLVVLWTRGAPFVHRHDEPAYLCADVPMCIRAWLVM